MLDNIQAVSLWNYEQGKGEGKKEPVAQRAQTQITLVYTLKEIFSQAEVSQPDLDSNHLAHVSLRVFNEILFFF